MKNTHPPTVPPIAADPKFDEEREVAPNTKCMNDIQFSMFFWEKYIQYS